MIKKRMILISMMILLCTIYVYAFPIELNKQGVLRFSNGSVTNSTFTFNVSIYNSSDDSLVYSEQKNITTSNGIYNYIVGQSALIASAIFKSDLYMQTKIDDEIFNSLNFSIVPYSAFAFHANDTDFLGGIPAADYVRVNNIIEGDLFFSGFRIKNESSNGLWKGLAVINSTNESNNQLLFIIEGSGKTGVEMPHFWIQNGGEGQASGTSRSFMIVNEEVTLQNTTNITSCLAFTDFANDTLKIDCNTTTTGADLLVGDDMQVLGDIFIKDTEGEYHFLTREIQLLDEMFSNVTLTGLNGTLVGNNLTIFTKRDETIVVNIDAQNAILTRQNDSILLTQGTNETPILNQVFYSNISNPTLQLSTKLSEDVTSVATFLEGADFTYASLIGGKTSNELVKGIYNRWLDQGAIYKGGFNITTSTENINISTGIMKILLETLNINVNHSTADFFIHIQNNGTFHQHTDLDDCSTYSSGEAISNNKFFNIVCGIANTHDEQGVMYCMTQDKPDTEHTKAIDAQLDVDFLRFFPNQEVVKKAYIPIVRAVIKRTGGDNVIQTLSTGNLFLDLRGTITANAGSTPSPGISSHPSLNDLECTVSGHTNIFCLNVTNSISGNQTYGGTTLFIDSTNGRVSIGTLLTTYGFTVNDTSTSSMNVSDTLFVDGNNKFVGIGTSTPSETLEIVGSINASTTYFVNSDQKICLGTNSSSNCVVFMMYNSSGGFGELG